MNVLYFAEGQYGTGFEITCESEEMHIGDTIKFIIADTQENRIIEKDYIVDDIVSNSFVLPVIITKEESELLKEGIYKWGTELLRENELRQVFVLEDNIYQGKLIVRKGV